MLLLHQVLADWRSGHVCVAYAGKIWVVGGYDGSYNPLKSMEVFDPATWKWSFGASLHKARAGGGGMLVNDQLHVLGGKPDAKASTEMYDFVSQTWTLVSRAIYDGSIASLTAAVGETQSTETPSSLWLDANAL